MLSDTSAIRSGNPQVLPRNRAKRLARLPKSGHRQLPHYIKPKLSGFGVGWVYLSQPVQNSGLGLGTTITSLIFFAAILATVIYMSKSHDGEETATDL